VRGELGLQRIEEDVCAEVWHARFGLPAGAWLPRHRWIGNKSRNCDSAVLGRFAPLPRGV